MCSSDLKASAAVGERENNPAMVQCLWPGIVARCDPVRPNLKHVAPVAQGRGVWNRSVHAVMRSPLLVRIGPEASVSRRAVWVSTASASSVPLSKQGCLREAITYVLDLGSALRAQIGAIAKNKKISDVVCYGPIVCSSVGSHAERA